MTPYDVPLWVPPLLTAALIAGGALGWAATKLWNALFDLWNMH